MNTFKLTPQATENGKRKTENLRISIPGSKSYTNRALLMAALAHRPTIMRNPLISDDTIAMKSCLQAWGAQIDESEHTLTVYPRLPTESNTSYELNAKLSGTTLRFLTAAAAFVPATTTLTGDPGLCRRPIADLVEALKMAGSTIEYLEQPGHAPVRIHAGSTIGSTIKVDGSMSSQYVSALLMAAPLSQNEMIIEVVGELISKPYIDMTIEAMAEFGVTVQNYDYRRFVIPAKASYACSEYIVEADFSSASYFAALAALTRTTISLTNVNPASKQADLYFLEILQMMGNPVTHTDGVTIHGKGVRSITINMERAPDQVQTLAVLVATVDGTTTINGVRSLRVKETERVAAMEAELAKLGIRTDSTHDTLIIYGNSKVLSEKNPIYFETYGDHRMAMSLALLGCVREGIHINNPEVVSKTFPTFWNVLESTGVGVEKIKL